MRIYKAADECQDRKGEIVSITSEQEFNFVISHMEQCMYKFHKKCELRDRFGFRGVVRPNLWTRGGGGCRAGKVQLNKSNNGAF